MQLTAVQLDICHHVEHLITEELVNHQVPVGGVQQVSGAELFPFFSA